MKEIKSLYIHFPFCREICNYCDFYKRRLTSSDDFSNFEHQLENNLKEYLKLCDLYEMKQVPLETLYIGGGTPSLWGSRGIEFLDHLFYKYSLSLAESGEFTMEFNPEDISRDQLQGWMDWGINRFSLGIQSLDDNTLNLIGRTHTYQETLKSLEIVQDCCDNYSFDLMLGLPYSSNRQLNVELETLMQFDPTHLSVYMMTVGSQYLHAQGLPDDIQLEAEYLLTADLLQSGGYSHYEISNFAKKGFESQHNLQYWKSGPMGALGASATGYFPLQNGAMRYRWLVSSSQYRQERLDVAQLQLERFYLGLRINDEMLWEELSRQNYFSHFKDWLNKNSFLLNGENRLNSRGYLMLDSVMDKLFELRAC